MTTAVVEKNHATNSWSAGCPECMCVLARGFDARIEALRVATDHDLARHAKDEADAAAVDLAKPATLDLWVVVLAKRGSTVVYGPYPGEREARQGALTMREYLSRIPDLRVEQIQEPIG